MGVTCLTITSQAFLFLIQQQPARNKVHFRVKFLGSDFFYSNDMIRLNQPISAPGAAS